MDVSATQAPRERGEVPSRLDLQTCQRGLELVKIPTEVYEHAFYRFTRQKIDICLITEV